MAWAIEYTATARKQLRGLDQQQAQRILDFMDERVAASEDPRKIGKPLSGPRLGDFWRYRVGDYRVICEIQEGRLCVLVVTIGNRREVYR